MNKLRTQKAARRSPDWKLDSEPNERDSV